MPILYIELDECCYDFIMSSLSCITLKADHNDVLVAALTALAIIIHVFESAIPAFIPGFKPGLANVITLVCFFEFGLNTAVRIGLMRVFIGSLLIGSFLTPTFVLSFSGQVMSLLVLSFIALFFRGKNKWFGPVGISVLASVAHILGQFLLAWWLFLPHPQLIYLLPVLIFMAIFTGMASGFATIWLMDLDLFNPDIRSIDQES